MLDRLAAVGLGLALCTTAVASPRPRPAPRDGIALESLSRRPPAGCTLGASGPTFQPAHALRRARRHALAAWFTAGGAVRVESRARVGPARMRVETTQDVAGWLRDARIAAVWSQQTRVGGHRRIELFALACASDAGPQVWPRGFRHRDAGARCALGIAGPTRDAARQLEVALRDARDVLATARESRIEVAIQDDGRGGARRRIALESSERARTWAATAALAGDAWLDVDGRGPLDLPGVLYAPVCARVDSD